MSQGGEYRGRGGNIGRGQGHGGRGHSTGHGQHNVRGDFRGSQTGLNQNITLPPPLMNLPLSQPGPSILGNIPGSGERQMPYAASHLQGPGQYSNTSNQFSVMENARNTLGLPRDQPVVIVNMINPENLNSGLLKEFISTQSGMRNNVGYRDPENTMENNEEQRHYEKRGNQGKGDFRGRGRRPGRGMRRGGGRGRAGCEGGGLGKRSMSEMSLNSITSVGDLEDRDDNCSVGDRTEVRQEYEGQRRSGTPYRPRGGRRPGRGARTRQHQDRGHPETGTKQHGPKLILGEDGNVVSGMDESQEEDEDVEETESVSGEAARKDDGQENSKQKHDQSYARRGSKPSSRGKQGKPFGGKGNQSEHRAPRAEQESEVADLLANLGSLSTQDTAKMGCETLPVEKGKPKKGHSPRNDGNRNVKAKESTPKPVPKEKEKFEAADENVKTVFNILLQKFNGRAEFAQLLKENDLPEEAKTVSWFKKHGYLFLLFKENKEVKFVSVFSKYVRMCRTYNANDCTNENCTYLHICMHFVTGGCKYLSCLSHNLFDNRNNKRIQELGFGVFKNKDVAKIVRCSLPEWCEEYQSQGDRHVKPCPLIHVCRNEFCTKQCGLEHDIKGSAHNRWVLDTFGISHYQDIHLNNMLLHRQRNYKQVQIDKRGEESEVAAASSEAPNVKKTSAKKQKPKPRRAKKPQSTTDEQDIQDHEALTEDLHEPGVVEPPLPKPRKPHVTEPQVLVPERPVPKPRIKEEKLLIDLNSDSDSESDDELSGTALCEAYVWGECSKRSHFHGQSRLPYQWQIQMYDGWMLFEPQENEKIEMAFCNLQKRVGEIKVSDELMCLVTFDSMKALTYIKQRDGDDIPGESVPVQRLSTPSYVTGTDQTMTGLTQWCWYFYTDNNTWCPYIPATLQYTLEMKYLSGQPSYLFELKTHQYEVDFSKMQQTNLNTDKRRPMLRRPVFVSSDDVSKRTKVLNPDLLSRHPPVLMKAPEGWAPLDYYQIVELVKLDAGMSREGELVQNMFFSTMDQGQFKIRSLYRIQNSTLWQKYCSMKSTMEKIRQHEGLDGTVRELQLFHGTEDSIKVIRGICHNNVDFRLSGKHGTVYGEGAYFARDAKYSHCYTRGAVRFMFLCRVLVGQYVKGESSYRRPPVRVGHTLYDSCVDSVSNPSIYVVFDMAQSYPEYLIEYTMTESQPLGGNPVSPSLSQGGLASSVSPVGATSPASAAGSVNPSAVSASQQTSVPRYPKTLGYPSTNPASYPSVLTYPGRSTSNLASDPPSLSGISSFPPPTPSSLPSGSSHPITPTSLPSGSLHPTSPSKPTSSTFKSTPAPEVPKCIIQ